MTPADTCMIVMAHGAAKDAVHRHLPYWRKVAAHIAFFVPLGETIDPPEDCLEFAMVPNGGKYSPETNERTQLALGYGARQTLAPWVLFMEYDAMVWGPIPEIALPPPRWIAGSVFKASELDGKRFSSRYYLHTPNILTPDSCGRLLAEMELLPMDAEGGYNDRYMGYAAEWAQLSLYDWHSYGLSFSRESISFDNIDTINAAVAALQAGALFSHGIKTERALNHLLPYSGWARKAVLV